MGGTGTEGLMASEGRRELELAEGKGTDRISLIRPKVEKRELTIRSTGPHPTIAGDIHARFPSDLTHPDPTVFLDPALSTYCGRLEARGLWRWLSRVDRHRGGLCSLYIRGELVIGFSVCECTLERRERRRGERREMSSGLTDRDQRPARWTWRNTVRPHRRRVGEVGEGKPYWRVVNEG